MKWREFRFDREKGKTLTWSVAQDNEWYFTKFGQVGGKIQETSDRPGPKGKEGTAAYVDPVANCSFHMLRAIRHKTENGYQETVNGIPLITQTTTFTFSDFLPKNFTGPKPQTSITDTALAKLHKSGNARYTRKFDGFACIAVHHNFGWHIYSRRIDLMSDHFPNHIKELEATNLKVGTILTGEMCVLKDDCRDDFKSLSRVCRSLPEEARVLVDSGEIAEPFFTIYDCLYKDGESLENVSYDDRAKIWKKEFTECPTFLVKDRKKFIYYVPSYQLSPDKWQDLAKTSKWEGFVVVDGSSVLGNKGISMNGKPNRMKGSFKLKPVYDCDVVIYAAVKGTGKRLDKPGAVMIKQIHPDTGKWFSTGKSGSGFTDENLEELEKLMKKYGIPLLDKEKDAEKLDINNNKGIVMVLEFSERTPSNKFRFPVFKSFHLDKKAEECIADNLFVGDEEE